MSATFLSNVYKRFLTFLLNFYLNIYYIYALTNRPGRWRLFNAEKFATTEYSTTCGGGSGSDVITEPEVARLTVATAPDTGARRTRQRRRRRRVELLPFYHFTILPLNLLNS